MGTAGQNAKNGSSCIDSTNTVRVTSQSSGCCPTGNVAHFDRVCWAWHEASGVKVPLST